MASHRIAAYPFQLEQPRSDHSVFLTSSRARTSIYALYMRHYAILGAVMCCLVPINLRNSPVGSLARGGPGTLNVRRILRPSLAPFPGQDPSAGLVN